MLLSLAARLDDFAIVIAALVIGVAGVVLQAALGSAAVNGISHLL